MKAEFKLEGLDEVKKMFSSDLMRKTLRSTLDKSATEIKKEIVKDVAEKYDVAPKNVRDKINIQRTTQSALEVSLNIRSKRLSLLLFKARQAPKGVLANIKKGAVSFYKSAFIVAPWRKVMVRTGKKRLPIQHRAGPSPTEMIKTEPILKKIDEKWPQIMSRKFKEEVDRRMRSK